MDPYQQTADLYNQIAEQYQEKFMGRDLYNDTYDVFCDNIPRQNARILEIGCGPGNVTQYLLSKRSDFKLTGTDFAPNMVKLAQANNPSAAFEVLDCRDISKFTGHFDGIMGGFVMPYLTKEDCRKLIQDCADLLNSGGIFYFSVAEAPYEKSGYRTGPDGTPFLFYYHQENYLAQYLKENGFETAGIFRKNYPLADGASETHLIMIARKK